ncbi:MAG: translation initiation factor IF-2, partial [Adhaeribacter sp.]
MNISTSTVVDFLAGKGFDIENKPTSKITPEQFNMLLKAFESSMQAKIEAAELSIGKKPAGLEPEAIKPRETEQPKAEAPAPAPTPAPAPAPAPASPAPEEKGSVETGMKLPGFKILGKIDLDAKGQPLP